MESKLVIVRGGGDIATGTIYKLKKAGFSVLVLETAKPTAIRRKVAFSEAVYLGKTQVEDMTCVLVTDYQQAMAQEQLGLIPMMVDEQGQAIRQLQPWAVVDAILAKQNLGTNRRMARHTIGLGPGFEAGVDVDLVIETMRGHNLGRIIEQGMALPNTCTPGLISNIGQKRVIHAPAAGVIHNIKQIAESVEAGETIAVIDDGNQQVKVKASITGLLRGIIAPGYKVSAGLKIADIDPRQSEYDNCFTISDKARCIAGAVLEGLLYLENKKTKEKEIH